MVTEQDLNRSFPDWAQLGQELRQEEGETWEPEVAAVMKHVMENRFVLSVDYHDGWTGCFLVPYSIWNS